MRNRIYHILVTIQLITLSFNVSGQSFVNNDLEGPLSGTVPPPGWLNVPFTDVNCFAQASYNATPDVIDVNGPSLYNGLIGSPYSGVTFVSGLRNGSFHEGIMQNVSGFIPGQFYKISFYQTVVKQYFINNLDTSGSWSVYMEDTLIGTSNPSVSQLNYDDTALIWNYREVTFEATASQHLIKFLPEDDDTDFGSGVNGGLRMGIDYVNLQMVTSIRDNENLSELINIYPNPVTDQLYIDGAIKITNAQIIDMTGRQIKIFTEVPNAISVVDLPKGIYFLKLATEQGSVTKKFIKQ